MVFACLGASDPESTWVETSAGVYANLTLRKCVHATMGQRLLLLHLLRSNWSLAPLTLCKILVRQAFLACSAAKPKDGALYRIASFCVAGFGADLSEDHPGFHDNAYKQRRAWIADLARHHR